MAAVVLSGSGCGGRSIQDLALAGSTADGGSADAGSSSTSGVTDGGGRSSAGRGGNTGASGGSAGSSTSAGAPPGPSSPVTCDGAGSQLQISTQVDGQELRFVRQAYDHDFTNKRAAAPGELNVRTASGRLRIEFDQELRNEQSSSARGIFEDDDLRVGNCPTGAFVSTIDMLANAVGVRFTLRQLAHEPYCDGEPFASGQLDGCFSFGF